MTIAEELAQFVYQCDFEKLPSDVVEKAKACVLDWIGCAVAGIGDRAAEILVQVALEQPSNANATVVGHARKISPLWAAFANAALSHAAEMDDGHKWAIIHGAVVTIPAAFALGEQNHVSGKDLIEAVVAGYELALRAGESVGKAHYSKWHTTGTAGTFGAAAASAKILGLPPNAIADSLGNAGTQAAGLWQFLEDKAMTKVLHPAKACFNGMLAAMLAGKGFTGPHRIFEGKKGFCLATSTNPNLEALTRELGKSYKIRESNFKLYPSCGHTHSPIDAIMSIRESRNISPEEVKSIRISTYSEAKGLISNPAPKTPFEAKFSAPFCVATALVYGRIDPSRFTDQTVADPVVQALASKVELVVDPKFDSLFPSCRPARVELFLQDGTCLSAENFYRKGDPENPLKPHEIEAKFRQLTQGYLNADQVEKILTNVKQLERVEDIGVIAKALSR
ncbi:MAG TPA: MmgE/PrpD family protein [Firmicutes bacterium]|nr:MmgE/PrpD family protein [Bacillota bacterium]